MSSPEDNTPPQARRLGLRLRNPPELGWDRVEPEATLADIGRPALKPVIDFKYLESKPFIEGCPFYDKGPDGDLAA